MISTEKNAISTEKNAISTEQKIRCSFILFGVLLFQKLERCNMTGDNDLGLVLHRATVV